MSFPIDTRFHLCSFSLLWRLSPPRTPPAYFIRQALLGFTLQRFPQYWMLLRFVVFQPRRLNFRVLLRVKIRWLPIVFPQYWMPRSSLELPPSKAFPSLPYYRLHDSSSPCGPSVSEWRCFSICRSSTGCPASFRPIATPEYYEQRVVLHFLKSNLPSWAS